MTSDLVAMTPRSFSFGPFLLLPERQLLLKGDEPIRLGGRALDLLVALVERPGEVVTKRELMARAWPDVVVDEANLKVNIAALRKALGDGSSATHYIATVSGRGYRFIAALQTVRSSGAISAVLTPTKRTHNLPTGTTRLFGRNDAIEIILGDLSVTRLVSVVGAGGIGKTTVALAVAERAIGSFKDGVWLVDLAPLRDPALVADAVATALGLAAHSANTLSTLCDLLREQQMLIVIDNCEHIIEAAASCVDRILAAAAGVKVLTTSREPLLVRGERVRRLSGLEAPPSSSRVSADEALKFAAIQLFVDRATDRMESFTLRDADVPVVADLCRRLDGLALAIELAATRIDAFGVSGLLQQIDDRFPTLTGFRTGPERHRTLTATLDWSYGLLTASEASLIRAIAVFAGVFDVEAAAAVSNVSAAEAGQTLAQLLAKSLLTTDVDADRVAYRLLETTRAYCFERLQEAGENGLARQRHAEYMCALLEQATAEWTKRPADEWASAYVGLLDDLRAALAWTTKDTENRVLRIRLTVAGILLWNHFSLIKECGAHVSRAVGELDAAGLAGTAFEMKIKLWLGGATMFTHGLKPRAMEALRRALEIAIQLGDADSHLRCLVMIGTYELFTGQHNAGMRTLATFASVAAAKDPSVLPEGEVHFSMAELFLGHLEAARCRLEGLNRRDLRYFGSYGIRYLSDPHVLVSSVLAQVQWLTGYPDTAAQTVEKAVELADQSMHHLTLNNILSYGCPIFFWSGHFEECGRYVAMLAENVTRHGLVARRPVATFYRAALVCMQDDRSPDGVEGLQRAIEEFHDINHLARMPYYLSVLADAQAVRGQFDNAQRTIKNAVDIAREQSEGWCLPEVLRVHASILTAQGMTEQAEELLGRAMALADEVGSPSWRLRAANDLAKLWCLASKEDDACALLSSVVNQFTEGFMTRDLLVAADIISSADPNMRETA